MSYDWDYISTLLHVAEKAGQHPKLKNITSAALAELDAIANSPQEPEEEEPPADPAPPSGSETNNGRRV